MQRPTLPSLDGMPRLPRFLPLVWFFGLCLLFSFLPLWAQAPTFEREAQQLLHFNDRISEARRDLRAQSPSEKEARAALRAIEAERAAFVKRFTPDEFSAIMKASGALRSAQVAERAAARKAERQAAQEAKAAARAEAVAQKRASEAEMAAQRRAAAELSAATFTADVKAGVEADATLRRLTALPQYRPLSPEEQDLKTEAVETLAALRQRYDTPETDPKLRSSFQAETTKLTPKNSPALQAEWLAQALPSDEQLALDLSEPRERAAAAFFFFALLEERVRPPFPDEVEARSRRYQEMLNAYGNASSGNRAASLQEVATLSQGADFQIKTTERYVPGLAVHYRQKAEEKRLFREQQEAVKAMATRSVALLVLVFVLPWVIIARRSRPSPAPLPSVRGSAVLPPDLGWIDVPSRRYAVDFTTGVVTSKEVWTETTTHTHQAPGTTTMHGNIPIHTPGPTTTSTSTKLFHRYWLLHPDGSQGWNRFTDATFLAAIGHPISTLSYDARVLVAYNASTGAHTVFPDAVKAANSLPLGASWWLPILITILGAPWVVVGFDLALLPAVAPVLSQYFLSIAPLVYGFGFLLYLGIIKLIYRARSYRAFRRDHLPKLLEFMRAHTHGEPPVQPAK